MKLIRKHMIPTVNMMCVVSCNFKITNVRWDLFSLLTLTFDLLVSKGGDKAMKNAWPANAKPNYTAEKTTGSDEALLCRDGHSPGPVVFQPGPSFSSIHFHHVLQINYLSPSLPLSLSLSLSLSFSSTFIVTLYYISYKLSKRHCTSNVR